MLIKAQHSDGDAKKKKKRNSLAQNPHEAYCRENIVFKLITCFMYLDGRTLHEYIIFFGVPSGQNEKMKWTEMNNDFFFSKSPPEETNSD